MGRHGENIRKRTDGRWEGRYKVIDPEKGTTIYRSVYSHAYEEVKEKLSKARLGLLCQTEKKKEQQSETRRSIIFSQAAAEWLEEVADKRKYSTYIKYNSIYQTHLAETVGSKPLSDAAQGIQQKISDHLSKGRLSESIQKSIFCIVNQILKFANQNYLADVPLLKGILLKTKKKRIFALSEAEQTRLLFCVRNRTDQFKTAVLLCLYTGLRLGELCALKWTDLDIDNMSLTVNRTVQRVMVKGYRTKTILQETTPKSENSRRTIPLTSEILELLMLLKTNQPYIFGGKKPLDPRTMQYRFKKILKEAGIKDRNFHLLRHTFATNCAANQMDVKALSELLGHSDVKISLNRYVHPTMNSKRKQIGLLLDFYDQICGQIHGQVV